jgi:hypothetical protein
MLGEEEDLKKQNGIMNDARRRRRHEAQKFEKREAKRTRNLDIVVTIPSKLQKPQASSPLLLLLPELWTTTARSPESKCFGGGGGKVAMTHRKI